MASALNFLLTLDPRQALAALSQLQQRLAATAAAGANPTSGITAGAAASARALGGLTLALGGVGAAALAVAGGAFAPFAKDAVAAATQAENAFKGLESVSNRTGVGIGKAWSAVGELTKDGVLNQTQAAAALKNLFSFGITDADKAVAMINRIKDASAFGAQAGLDWADAIVTATEGIRNENSELVDNAGITKNVAKIYEEYAQKLGVTYESLTKGQKETAIYNGIMKETELQAGNTAVKLAGMQGSTARLNQSVSVFNTTVGNALTPTFARLRETGSLLLNEVFTPLVKKLMELDEASSKAPSWAPAWANKTGGEMLNDWLRPGGPPPPIPANTAQIPPPSTNKTGIPIAGPDGKPITGPSEKDKADAARYAKEKADEEAKALAKQQLVTSEKALARQKQSQADELAVYKSGLDAQRAELQAMLARNQISHAEYAKRTAAMSLAEEEKSMAVSQARQIELQKQVELAKRSGDQEKIADAQASYDTEVASATAALNRVKQLRTEAAADLRAGAQQDAEQQRQIDEQLYQARANAQRTTSEAIAERELAETQAMFDKKLITEEDYIRKSAALQDAMLAAELKRLEAQQEFARSKPAFGPQDTAAAKAQQVELAAQVAATEQKRAQLAAETDAKLVVSARQLLEMRIALDQELLEAEGRTFDARSKAIDAWLAQKREEFSKLPELMAKAEAVAAAQQKQNSFNAAQDGVSDTQSRFSSEEAALQREAQRGLVTDIELDRRSLDLKRQQAEALRERLALMKQFASDTPAAAQAIRDVENQIAELDGAFSSVAASINERFFSDIEDGFKDLATRAKKPLDALRDVVVSTLSQIASLALRSGLQSLLGGVAGGGGGWGGMIASMFGGFREKGGSVQAGKAYVVGEKGPELMFAGMSGTIASNAAIQKALAGPAYTQVPRTTLPRSAAAMAPATGGSTNLANTVNVSPRVTISTSDIIAGLRGDPEYERFHVETSIAHRRRINKG